MNTRSPAISIFVVADSAQRIFNNPCSITQFCFNPPSRNEIVSKTRWLVAQQLAFKVSTICRTQGSRNGLRSCTPSPSLSQMLESMALSSSLVSQCAFSAPLTPNTSCCHGAGGQRNNNQALRKIRRLIKACTNLPLLEATYSSSHCSASTARVCKSFAPNFVRKPTSSTTCSVTSNCIAPFRGRTKAPRSCPTTQDRFKLAVFQSLSLPVIQLLHLRSEDDRLATHASMQRARHRTSVKCIALRTTDLSCLISSIALHFVCTFSPNPRHARFKFDKLHSVRVKTLADIHGSSKVALMRTTNKLVQSSKKPLWRQEHLEPPAHANFLPALVERLGCQKPTPDNVFAPA